MSGTFFSSRGIFIYYALLPPRVASKKFLRYFQICMAVICCCTSVNRSLMPTADAFRSFKSQHIPLLLHSGKSNVDRQALSPVYSSKAEVHYSLDGQRISGPLKPLMGYVLIQRKDPVEVTSGGIYIPTESRGKQVIGRILSSGGEPININTGMKVPMEVTVGDWVIIGKHDGHSLKYNEKDCVIIRGDEILGKIEEKEGNSSVGSISPIGDVVFVKLESKDKKSDSGLIISQGEGKNSPCQGKVISTGRGSFDNNGQRLPMEVQSGDNVRFSTYMANEMMIEFDHEKYMFLHSKDIIAKW